MNRRSQGIAVVGMACWYPGTRNVQQLWENVLAKRQEFRRMPKTRLSLEDYFDPDPSVPDKSYGQRAALLDGFIFDWAGYRIPQATFEATDIAQWVALEVARQAFLDAGWTRENIPREKTGVLLGNSLTGEQMRANYMRLRWPFVARALRSAARATGLPASARDALAATMEQHYKSVFPPVTEDSLAGSLSNTIAGRICNYFDVHGGGYTVDAACASSLVAVCNAADQLDSGALDVVLAGGVDISLDTLEFIGFAKATALTAGDMQVYDRRGSGFIAGEGCGFVVLKRLEDAVAAGDMVYAVIKGWGTSSDGRGGIMQPTRTGQATALRRAYERAGYSPRQLDFVEGHGTGTRVGDKVEIEAVADVLEGAAGGALPPRACGITSLKAVIGHTKAAAGIGALLKAVIAANRRVVPAFPGCTQPNAVFETTARALYPVLQGEVRPPEDVFTVGVSAMGFGGINSHVTLQSADRPSPRLAPSVDERALLVSHQESELFVLGAGSIPELVQALPALASEAENMSPGDLTDFAAYLAGRVGSEPRVRAAVIASSPAGLAERLRAVQVVLRGGGLDDGHVWVSSERDVWVSSGRSAARVAFLLPGQGSQQLSMARVLVERFDWARELLEELDTRRVELGLAKVGRLIYRATDRAANPEQLAAWATELSQTANAQPAICLASVLHARFLGRLGIKPTTVMGHSLGELTAFHLAGAIDEWTLFGLASLRGRLMGEPQAEDGAMLSLSASLAQVTDLVGKLAGYATVANINSPRQVVASGTVAGIDELTQLAARAAIEVRRLPVSNAFHSKLMTASAARLAKEAELPARCGPLSARLFSSMDGREVLSTVDLREHFSRQVLTPVDFAAAGVALRSVVDLALEVGPGRVLSGLMRDIVDKDFTTLPLEPVGGVAGSHNTAVAACFVHGVSVGFAALFEQRLTRPFTAPSAKVFIGNPCERPLPGELSTGGAAVDMSVGSALMSNPEVLSGALGVPVSVAADYLMRRGDVLRRIVLEVARADLGAGPGGAEALTPAVSVPVPSPPSAPRPAPSSSLEALVLGLVAARTGYPAATISLGARLLDDLNVDSIKAGEVVGAAAREAGVVGKVDPSALANASLQVIADALRAAGGHVSPATVAREVPHPATTPVAVPILQQLLDAVAKRTGYPLNTITPEARLLDDLNLDSIKAGELIASVAARAGAGGKLDPGQYANGRIREVAEAISAAAGGAAAKAHPAPHATTDVRDIVLEMAQRLTGFGPAAIQLSSTVHRDLGLLPEKIKELIQLCWERAGLEPRIDVARFYESTLAQIASVLAQLKQRHEAQPVDDLSLADSPTWVHAFAVRTVPAAAPLHAAMSLRTEDSWTEATVLLVTDEPQGDYGQAFQQKLLGLGARVESVRFMDAESAVKDRRFSHLLALLPSQAGGGTSTERIRRMLTRLLSVCNPPLAQDAPRRRTTVAYVQFGHGHFGAGTVRAAPETCAATSFARSLHLERSDLRVRVVDLSPALSPATVAELTLEEVATPEGFAATGFDADCTRLQQKLELVRPRANVLRPATFGAKDVILVTGGGKGITAECAMAWARQCGATLALLGRQRQSGEVDAPPDELSETLRRMKDAGVRYRYYPCDVTRLDEVQTTVARVREELGPITALVHGAGVMKPRKAGHLNVASALEEISPKLLGALNLLATLEVHPPRLIVGFTSLSGVMGVPGTTVYGYSNEALDLSLRQFQDEHPGTATVSVAWGPWGEVGRAVKFGTSHNLTQMGYHLGNIPTSDAVSHFLTLVGREVPEHQVVVVGRVVGFDTWEQLCEPLPVPTDLRFVDRVVRVQAGVEAIVRTKLTLERDLYLGDHIFHGMYVVPSVYSMEAAAQVATFVSGTPERQVVRMEDLDLPRPLVVDADHGLELELRALVLPSPHPEELRVRVELRAETTGFQQHYFSGVVVLGKRAAAAHVPKEMGPALGMNPSSLYGRNFFVQGEFQRMRSVHALANEESRCVVEAKSPSQVRAFGGDEALTRLLLGDAYARDCFLHSAILSEPQVVALPVGFSRIEFFAGQEVEPLLRHCVSTLTRSGEKDFDAALTLLTPGHQVLERIEGFRIRVMERHPEWPSAQQLATGATGDEQHVLDAVQRALQELAAGRTGVRE